MNKLFICIVLALAVSADANEGHWKNLKTKVTYPIYAQSIIYGKVPNAESNSSFSHITGTVRFVQNSFEEPVQVTVNITVKPPLSEKQLGMTHGFHIHEFGTMWSKNTTLRCGATGSHYNPKNVTHGFLNDDVRHVGDMGNVEWDVQGRIVKTFTDSYLHLAGFQTVVGRAVVLHEKSDDGGKTGAPLSATTGAAGSRIACGDIVFTPKF